MVKIQGLKGKCDMCHKTKANCIIRGKQVCPRCFDEINRDNYKRIEQGLTIPRNFEMLIPVM